MGGFLDVMTNPVIFPRLPSLVVLGGGGNFVGDYAFCGFFFNIQLVIKEWFKKVK